MVRSRTAREREIDAAAGPGGSKILQWKTDTPFSFLLVEYYSIVFCSTMREVDTAGGFMSIKLTQQFPREWGSLASGIEMRVSLESKRARERERKRDHFNQVEQVVGSSAISSAG